MWLLRVGYGRHEDGTEHDNDDSELERARQKWKTIPPILQETVTPADHTKNAQTSRAATGMTQKSRTKRASGTLLEMGSLAANSSARNTFVRRAHPLMLWKPFPLNDLVTATGIVQRGKGEVLERLTVPRLHPSAEARQPSPQPRLVARALGKASMG